MLILSNIKTYCKILKQKYCGISTGINRSVECNGDLEIDPNIFKNSPHKHKFHKGGISNLCQRTDYLIYDVHIIANYPKGSKTRP